MPAGGPELQYPVASPIFIGASFVSAGCVRSEAAGEGGGRVEHYTMSQAAVFAEAGLEDEADGEAEAADGVGRSSEVGSCVYAARGLMTTEFLNYEGGVGSVDALADGATDRGVDGGLRDG